MQENRQLKIHGAVLPPKKRAKDVQKSRKAAQSDIPPADSEILDISTDESLTSDGAFDKNNHQRVVSTANKFSVMNEIFIKPNAFLVARPDQMTLHRRPDRYTSSSSKRAAIVAELYDELAEDLHTLLEKNVAFRKTVRDLFAEINVQTF